MAANNQDFSLTIITHHDCLRAVMNSSGVLDTCCCLEFVNSSQGYICNLCGCHRNHHRRQEILVNIKPELAQILRQVVGGEPPSLSLFLQCRHLWALIQEADQNPPPQQRQRAEFTQRQKILMFLYAETVGWSLLHHNPVLLAQYSELIGVTPQQLKRWVNNHRGEYKSA